MYIIVNCNIKHVLYFFYFLVTQMVREIRLKLMRLRNSDENPMIPFLYWEAMMIPHTKKDVENLNVLKSILPKEIVIKY